MTAGDGVGFGDVAHDGATVAQPACGSGSHVPSGASPAATVAPGTAEAASKNQSMRSGLTRRGSTGGAAPGVVSVGDLPIHKHRDEILEHINNNFITCIQGETGCGKSTQVPKFLLDQDALAMKTLGAIRDGKPPPPATIPLPPLTSYRPLKCIVTQPRRVACIALAQRVARELGEDTGGVVGYRISGESRVSKRTKVFFMTTGYLLQILVNAQPALARMMTEEELNLEASGKLAALRQRAPSALESEAAQQPLQDASERASDGYLDDVTHVVLDEVHERDVDADLLSLVLKLQLRSRIGRLKMIVMSATMQGNLFFNYFSDIHLKNVPGEDRTAGGLELGAEKNGQARGENPKDRIFVGAKRFPVHIVYIEDLLKAPEGQAEMRQISQAELSGAALLMEGKDEDDVSGDAAATVAGAPGQRKPQQRGLSDVDILTALLERKGKTHADILTRGAQRSLSQALLNFDRAATRETNAEAECGLQPDLQTGFEKVCVDLVSSLCYGGETILIFLAGIAEISTLFEALAGLERPATGSTSKTSTDMNAPPAQEVSPTAPACKLFVLHSTIGREEQSEVFNVPPPDTCHVVLASNIAESSLTLPNCRVVIDFCLRRQMIYDPRRHASALVKAWTSHASSQQRSGRTGRVFPGTCIRLVSSTFYKNCLRVFDLPEMQTAPLDKLYITVAHLTKRLNAIALSANPAGLDGQSQTQKARSNNKPKSIHECMQSGCLTPSQLLLLTVQPPPVSALKAAQTDLRQQGSLDENGDITRLGYLMMQLPIDVRLCKLVYYGIVFGYPLDAVVLASCLASADLFAFPALMLLQRHSKASAGLEAALQLQQQLRTRALFDGGHLSEPLMLRNCFVEFLIHFASSTAELRARLARQASFNRSSRLELNMKLEYYRAAREFGRTHAVLPKRLVQATLLCCDLSQRVRRLLDKSSSAYKSLSFLLELLQDGSIFPPHLQQPPAAKGASGMQQQQRQRQQEQQSPLNRRGSAQVPQYTTAISYDPAQSAAAVESQFMSDSLTLKAVMTAAFSPLFMVGKVRTCLEGQRLVRAVVDGEGGGSEDDSAAYSWLSDCGIDVSRCFFFSRTSNADKMYHAHMALAAVLPGVDYVLISWGDVMSSYASVRASSAAAAEDPAVQNVLKRRTPDCLQSNFVLYFPPTPRNECFHFDHKVAAAASAEYKNQLRSPPRAEKVLEEQRQRQQRVEERRRRWLDGDSDSDDSYEGMGQIQIGVPAVHTASDLKLVNDLISQTELVKGNHIDPCKLFSFHPVCAQLINQFGCGRWKFTLTLPKLNSTSGATSASTSSSSNSSSTAGVCEPVETFKGSTGTHTVPLEFMRPTSPFAVLWHFLAAADPEPNASGKASKAGKVQGIFSYRCPMAVLGVCPEVVKQNATERIFKQPGEIYAVAVSQQNKDSVSQAWAEGVTVLPRKEALLLMLSFLPVGTSVELTVEASANAPVAITSIEMMEGLRLSPATSGSMITLSDLLRANVVGHLLAKSLQGEPQVTAGATAPASAVSRPAGKRGVAEVLISEDGSGTLTAAFNRLLTCCNEHLTPAEADELVRLSGGTPDGSLHLLFNNGLPFLVKELGSRTRSKKGSDGSSLSLTIPAFVPSEGNVASVFPVFNLQAIANHYESLIRKAIRRATPFFRKNPLPLPLSSRRANNRQRGRAAAVGGSNRTHHSGNQQRGRGDNSHQQPPQQQRASNRRRGRGGRNAQSAAGGWQQQPQHQQPQHQQQHQQHQQQHQQQQHQHQHQWRHQVGAYAASCGGPDGMVRNSHDVVSPNYGLLKKQVASTAFQGMRGNDPMWGNVAQAASRPEHAAMEANRRVDPNVPPVIPPYGQVHVVGQQQQRYVVGGAAVGNVLPQQQHYSHNPYREPQQIQQQHAYAPPHGYALQQPSLQQPFMAASCLPRQQQMHISAAGGMPFQQLQQQLQQLQVGAAVTPQRPRAQPVAHRNIYSDVVPQHLGTPAGRGGSEGAAASHSAFGG